MSHTIENFTQVTLILKDNPEDDGYWRTCWDLSDNGYAMDELLKSGNLKSGETVPLSDGLLRSMLVKAQKDARGFQNTLLGECSHGSMTESYNKAFRLYGQVASKFSELDESYDLDALAALQDKKPEGYKLLHCDTDLDGDVREAKALKRSFDRLSVEYRKALTPVGK